MNDKSKLRVLLENRFQALAKKRRETLEGPSADLREAVFSSLSSLQEEDNTATEEANTPTEKLLERIAKANEEAPKDN